MFVLSAVCVTAICIMWGEEKAFVLFLELVFITPKPRKFSDTFVENSSAKDRQLIELYGKPSNKEGGDDELPKIRKKSR